MPVMKDGEINVLLAKYGKFVYERFNENERVIIATNLRGEDLRLRLNGEFESVITGEKPTEVVLKKYDFEILIEKNRT